MTVTVDATGTDAFWGTSNTFTYGPNAGVPGANPGSNQTGITTTGSATAIALLFLWQNGNAGGSGPGTITAKWDPLGANQTFNVVATGTLVAGTNVAGLQAFILSLPNPASSGNKPIQITTTSGTGGEPYISAISFAGTDTTTPFRNGVGAGEAGGGGTQNPTITVTSPSGDIALAANSFDFQTATAISGTTIYNDRTGVDGGSYAHRDTGAGSTVMSASLDANDGWSYAAVSVQPPTGATGGGLSIPVYNFKIDKFKTPSRSMGPNAGLFQVKAYPIAAAVDTPASYVSRPFPPRQWNLNALLLRGTAQDFSSSAVETNPHWQGRTYLPQWAITRSLLLPRAVVESSSAVETNPHWKPGTLPPQWLINRLLAQNTAQDFSSSAVETNPHWVARTWPVQWIVNVSLVRGVTGDTTTVVTTPDTPPPFIPRTWLPQWALNIPLHQNTAQDFSSSAVETNPHWQGRSWSVAWSTQATLWQGAASDTPFAVIDTPAYFIPRTFPAQWLPNRALGQNTAQDFSSSAVETNVQFRPRTWPLQWALQASLLRGTAQDFSTLPPATQPVYARYGASHGIGALSAIPGEIPS